MPMIKNKSRQYLFKNKLNIRRKSKRTLMKESFLMLIIGLFLMLLIYFIPQKAQLFNSLKSNIVEIVKNLIEIFFYSLEILIILLISFTILLSLFLILGGINRFIKILMFKSRKISNR